MVLKQRWYQPRAFARSEMATATAERRQQGRTGIAGVQVLARPETAGGARPSMAERLATSGRSDG
jgi:hypothetical protein